MFFQHNRRRQNNYGIYLLAYQLFNSHNIPPVTLVVIIFQMAIFLGYLPALGQHKIATMCLLPSRILYRSEWLRMLASTIMHVDDMHLYFNMISFLWKGRRLEPLLGSRRFLLLLATFALATSSTMVGLSYLADEVFSFNDGDYMNQCAIGFSGVIFALKVLHTTYFPYSDYNLFGWLPVPSQFACWAELFLLQMLTPNASFIGHLSGIIVGLAYIRGPLKAVVDILENIISLLLDAVPESLSQTRDRTQSNNQNWFTNWGSGHGNSTARGMPSYGWREEQRRFNEYTGGMSEEEQMWRATQRSLYEDRWRSPLF
uniref:Rhomboid domain-containing protein n=1 Tax=Elaeophora elaphi TaxID=1147741 RepID=A0A0R3RRX7_9BILA